MNNFIAFIFVGNPKKTDNRNASQVFMQLQDLCWRKGYVLIEDMCEYKY